MIQRRSIGSTRRPQEANEFKPPVRSRIVKLEKSTRGVRLVDFQDLLRYLNSLSDRSPIQGTDKAKAGPAARRLKREEGAAK